MRSIHSDIPICVACGTEMAHLLRHGYRRCESCVASGRPHSLALARGVRTARLGTRVLGDYDPAGCAAAA
jgi:hypothetical protein